MHSRRSRYTNPTPPGGCCETKVWQDTHSYSWHGCDSSCSNISPAHQHHRTVDCILCSEELPIFTDPRDGQRTVSGPLCYFAMSHAFRLSGCDMLSYFRGRGKWTAWDMWSVYDEVTPAFCALAATPETADDWLCTLERLLVLLYDCTSSQEFVNGARKQFIQNVKLLQHYLSSTQSGLLTKPVTVGHKRWSRFRSFHLQVNGGGTGMLMTAGQLFLNRHKLVVNYCVMAAIKVA